MSYRYTTAYRAGALNNERFAAMQLALGREIPQRVWRWLREPDDRNYRLAVDVTDAAQEARVDAIVMRYLLVGE